MKATLVSVLSAASVLCAVPRASAQLLEAGDAPIVYGHHHLNATSVDAHRRFWVDTLGGIQITLGTAPNVVFKFPNVFVSLLERPAKGGTTGTTVDHVGFTVPNVRAMVDKVRAAGYPIITRAELPATYEVKEDIGFLPDEGIHVAFAMGPDDTKVEFVENTSMSTSIMLDHVHFSSPDVAAMKAWYVNVFGATPGMRGSLETADLPGVNLTFSAAPAPVGTRGRALDHIGFEVKNLEAFLKQLESRGIKIDSPYKKNLQTGLAVAFITDPWGTYIELNEGWNAVP